MNEIRFIELFAGIGGFRYGLSRVCEVIRSTSHRKDSTKKKGSSCDPSVATQERGQSNFTCVWANEIDKYACQIYRKNFGEGELYEGDITKYDERLIPDHDLLVGGFPCQAFSIAGKRKGFGDTRGTLFFDICRITKAKRPKLLLLENVKGLLSHDGGNTFGTIISSLDELGYDAEWQVLNSKDFGVPQNRERVFIVGHLRGESGGQVFPIGNVYGEANDLQQKTNRKRKGFQSHAEDNGLSLTRLETWRNAQGRPRVRRLTPIECERLQGFPDRWTEGISDTQRYKCLGNAVTTNVITAIGLRIKL